ncbi:MAG: endonuclease/exonuclease/phosphatase family protein, partial [Lewinella sp.]|nr:endonuclease/exonuclease/phosphatase family protein [Lewinella sp.]
LPVWDGNPEIFYFDPNGLNAPNNRFLSYGMEVSATAVFLEDEGDFLALPVQYTVSGTANEQAVRPRADQEITVGSLNCLLLFSNDNDFSTRVRKLARFIIERMQAPDILALQEIGDLNALQELAYQIEQFSPEEHYTPYFRLANGDLHLAYLVSERIGEVTITQLGGNLPFSLGGRLHDRPPLLLEVELPTEPATALSVLNVHMRSLIGIEGSNATFVRTKRAEQAASVAEMIQARQGDNLLVVGDYNAYPFTDGYVDVLSQMTGTSSLGALYPIAEIVDPPLVNHTANLPQTERYSYVFDGSAQLIDHILSTGLPNLSIAEVAIARGNADVAEAYMDNVNLANRASDHDAPVAFLQLEYPLASRDQRPPDQTGLSIHPNPLYAGQILTVRIDEVGQQHHLQLRVTNGQGQTIWTEITRADGPTLAIPTATWPAGSYLVSVSNLETGAVGRSKVVLLTDH